MKLTLPPWLLLHPTFAGATLLLLVLAAYPWLAPISAPAGLAAAAEARPATLQISPLPPLRMFAAVFERPLFSTTRRPSPAEPISPGAGSVAGRYQLLGVVSAGGDRRALVADGARRFEVVAGATLDGWTVARIEHDRLVLSLAGDERVLRLRRASASPTEPPSVTPGR
ncbi:MAG TPA: hypothetical protein VKQ73_02005 [Stellaceae bacterium]|nr:hypothetical protein [Stellaceae bacterium]